jgi:GT2 family glycosyltransferase/LmbE family N-acetylglucosaminyl deacetylase
MIESATWGGGNIGGRGNSFLPAGPWMVFVRSPGDEVLALGGSLMRARSEGKDVAVVYLTGATNDGAGFLPELRRVYLNSAPNSYQDVSSLVALVGEIGPATVFYPSRLEDDADLRAAASGVENLLADAGYCGAAWTYELTRTGDVNRAIDISSVVDAKHDALVRQQYANLLTESAMVRADLTERLRGLQTGGVAAAEAFWAVDRFEALKGVTSTLGHLAVRCKSSEATDPAKVSVVIRTQSRPQLLEEALASLVLQVYPNLDVIVVNDGGASVAAEIEPFRETLSLTLIELPVARGRCAAANAGIEKATGDWLLMLDDDDVYVADGIRALVAHAGDTDSVYFGKVESWSYEDGQRRYLRTFGGEYDADLMMFQNQIPFIGCLMPISQVRGIGGVDESLECFEDWDLYLRLAQRCRFKFVDQLVAEYRTFGQSFISGKGGVSLQERGLEIIFSRPLRCGDAAQLARTQIAVQRTLIPREVHREAAVAEVFIRDRFAGRTVVEIEQLRGEIGQLRSQFSAAAAAAQADVLVRNADIFVSIIIVNYNGRHHLQKCLPSVAETLGVKFEVIVVDNGSTDDSTVWMREHWPTVRIIDAGSNLGFGRANLIGVNAAKSSYVAMLNSDTVVTPNWLLQLVFPLLQEPEIGITCSQLRLLARPEILNARGGGMSRLGYGFDIDFGLPYVEPKNAVDLTPVDVLFPSGAAMLMRAPDFLDAGAFDPSFFMYHEDVDLGWRYWLTGRRVVLCPGSVVFHAFGGTTKVEQKSNWRDWMGNRHNLRSLWKNYELRNALTATKQLIGIWLRTGQFSLAWHVITWNVVHVRGTLRERKRLQRMRRLTDADLFSRGLITATVPPAPKMPLVGLNPDCSDWLVSGHLWPGRNSAIGRLGPGWYAPEQCEGGLARLTSGYACAFLRVKPNASGKLALELHLPQELDIEPRIVVRCNGQSGVFDLGRTTFWDTVEMPATASNDGLLRIEIENAAWRPHDHFNNADLRRLGCVVHHIAFADDVVDATPYAPSRVSVIITTYKRWDILELTLQALTRQDWQDFEVIVVDDGSNDGTFENLQKWQTAHAGELELKVFTQENTGQGIARNNGLTYAQGELVLFIGDDIIADPDFISQHVSRHRTVGMPCAVVGYTEWDHAGMRVTPLLAYANEAGHQFGYRYMKDGEDVPYTCFYTSNVSAPRHILGTEPFDPTFRTYGWEDIDVGYRLAKRGVRLVFNRKARTRHRHPMDLADFYRRQVKVGNAIAALYALHPELTDDQPLMPPLSRSHIGLTLARRIVPPLVPLISWLDSRMVRLPERVYNVVLGTGYWIGRGS